MKCPVCIQEGKSSQVRSRGGTSRTLLSCPAFYDEDGKHHHHDSNRSHAAFSCSNGHAFEVDQPSSCWCGWNKDALLRVMVYPKPAEDFGALVIKGLPGGTWVHDQEVLTKMMETPL